MSRIATMAAASVAGLATFGMLAAVTSAQQLRPGPPVQQVPSSAPLVQRTVTSQPSAISIPRPVSPSTPPVAQRQPPRSAPSANAQYRNELTAESRSQVLCESVADRIFVRHARGSECIAWYATPQPARAGATVIYFEGDVPASDLARPGFQQGYLAQMRAVFQRLAVQHSTRFVFIARPGVFGSSGNHAQRRSPGEMLAMNAAVDALRSRLGLGAVVLAGQSGGSTIAAALLTLGRRDVSCTVLGSGLLSVVDVEHAFRVRERLPDVRPAALRAALFDPTDRLESIAAQPARRVFVLGDPTDTRTPFPQQRQFADRLRGLGHHALAIEVAGTGELMHGVAHHTLPAAALCARGFDDTAIRRQVTPTGARSNQRVAATQQVR